MVGLRPYVCGGRHTAPTKNNSRLGQVPQSRNFELWFAARLPDTALGVDHAAALLQPFREFRHGPWDFCRLRLRLRGCGNCPRLSLVLRASPRLCSSARRLRRRADAGHSLGRLHPAGVDLCCEAQRRDRLAEVLPKRRDVDEEKGLALATQGVLQQVRQARVPVGHVLLGGPGAALAAPRQGLNDVPELSRRSLTLSL